ncbi:MAG TPA: hypothetical protein VFL36_09035 [Myxococcales bacterium]|nr:hypothetical protein [Myxococcales bacterium]
MAQGDRAIGRGAQQWSVLATERGAVSAAHLMSQVPPVQLSEQVPVQTTWQVEPLQLTLLEEPTV